MGELKAKEELGSDLEEEEEEPPTFLFCSARSVCALEDRGGGGRVQHGGKKKNRKRGELATYVRESVTRFTTVSFLLRLGGRRWRNDDDVRAVGRGIGASRHYCTVLCTVTGEREVRCYNKCYWCCSAPPPPPPPLPPPPPSAARLSV